MPDEPIPLTPPDLPGLDERKRKKKADKARGAWISFAGRIVAQIVGAVASVTLGVLVLQKYQRPAAPAAATAAALGAQAPTSRPIVRRAGQATIAVLPLENLSGAADQEYFVDGMTEALTAGLAKVEGLRVISRTSTMRYKTDHPSIREIAQALGADLLIEGSVLQAGEQVRITAQLIDGGSDEHLWAESYTRTLKDVIGLQDAVATAIATAIKGTVNRRPGSLAADHSVDAATYDLYLRGRHAWYLRTDDSMKAALAFFQQAVDRDPGFALAHVGLADTYALQSSPGQSPAQARTRMNLARAAAIRALDLDASLAEAHTALGGVRFFGDGDLADAEMKFRRAIELNPNYSVAHEWLALLLAERGRPDEAIQHVDTAVTLDPFEATMYQARGQVLYISRRFSDAAAALARALELTPRLPQARVLRVKALMLDGKAAEGLGQCDPPSGAGNIDLQIACIVAATRAGRADEAATRRAVLEAIRPPRRIAIAQVDAALGRFAQALPALERMAPAGDLPPVLRFDPLFADLRRQPQWPALAAAMAPRAPNPTAAAPVTR